LSFQQHFYTKTTIASTAQIYRTKYLSILMSTFCHQNSAASQLIPYNEHFARTRISNKHANRLVLYTALKQYPLRLALHHVSVLTI